MAVTGSGNFANHPTKEQLLKIIAKRIELLSKNRPLSKYLQKDISKMTWNELRAYNSSLIGEQQIRLFGHPIG
jgi:hypothetical protein